jgi:hypothetical protein
LRTTRSTGFTRLVYSEHGAPVGEEDESAQVVEGLAPVELAADPPPENLVGEPAQRMEDAQQLAVLDQGLGQGVLAGAGLEPCDEQGRGDVADVSDPPVRSRSS